MAMIKTGMNNKQMRKIAKSEMNKSTKSMQPKYKTSIAATDKARDNKENRGIGIMAKRKRKGMPILHDVNPSMMPKKKSSESIKHTGKFDGKSNKLGQGGRAAQMRAQGVPGGVIGSIARREGAAPGQRNYHK